MAAAASLALGAGLTPIASPAIAAPPVVPAVEVTILRGANEVAGGDANGIGIGVFAMRAGQGQICYLLSAAKINGTVTAAHIHKAPAGSNGPVVVPLSAPVNGPVATCVTVAAPLAADIAANPANYYANIHSSALPDGAIRGQLR
jgi:hypothetical protein